jgi:hypothetical protein
LKVQQPEKILANGDGSITLTFNLTPDQSRRWRQVAELASHAAESHFAAALIDYLAHKEITRRTEVARAAANRKTPSKNPRAIAPSVRKFLMKTVVSSGRINYENIPIAQQTQQTEEAVQIADLGVPELSAANAPSSQMRNQPTIFAGGCCFHDPLTGRR